MSAVPDFNAANDPDVLETQEWLDALEAVLEREGAERAHYLLEKLVEKARRSGAYLPYSAQTAVHQHHPAAPGGALAGRLRARGAHPLLLPLERDGDGGQGQQETTTNSAATSRASPRWARCSASARTISGTRRTEGHGGDLVYFQGHSAPGIYARAPARRPPDRGAAAQFPPRGGRQGRVLLSASLADAGLLAVPHGVDGPGADPGDLPGALPQVPACARPRQHREPQGLGVLRRRRDGRARVARRDRHGGAREARQPDLHRQLQPAAPRRSGARQRQDHPGAGRRVPRRRLERHQADLGLATGTRCSRATRTASCCASWRRPSTASTRTSRPTTAPSCASISSASIRSCSRWCRA